MIFEYLILALSLPFATAKGGVKIAITETGRRECTVLALGDGQSDTSNILKAFENCVKDATVIFPTDQTYWIGERLHVTLDNVDIKWQGQWLVR